MWPPASLTIDTFKEDAMHRSYLSNFLLLSLLLALTAGCRSASLGTSFSRVLCPTLGAIERAGGPRDRDGNPIDQPISPDLLAFCQSDSPPVVAWSCKHGTDVKGSGADCVCDTKEDCDKLKDACKGISYPFDGFKGVAWNCEMAKIKGD